MKYYTIREKGKDDIESKVLCRIDKGIFNIYTWENKSCGEWLKNDKYEKIFNSKDENYVIEIPDKKEIEVLKMITDDFAYDDHHTYISSDDEVIDSKGRKHKVHIYQDYRSIDGYSVDDGFDYNEVMYRNDYDYYIDKNKDYSILIKRNKETSEYYIFAITVDGNELVKEWYLPNNYSPDMKKIVLNYKFDDNKKIKEIKDVLKYINDDYYEIGKQLQEEGYNINCDEANGMKKEIYYIYRREDGSIGRIAKFSNCLFYGFEDGEWVEMPGLIKIFFEITDFEEISKDEVERIIKEEYMINTIEEFKVRYPKAAVVNYDVEKKYGYGLTYRTGDVKHVIEKFRKFKNEFITYPQIQPYSKLTKNYKMFIIRNNKIYELEQGNRENAFHIRGEARNINIDIFEKVFNIPKEKHDNPSNRETEPIYTIYE